MPYPAPTVCGLVGRLATALLESGGATPSEEEPGRDAVVLPRPPRVLPPTCFSCSPKRAGPSDRWGGHCVWMCRRRARWTGEGRGEDESLLDSLIIPTHLVGTWIQIQTSRMAASPCKHPETSAALERFQWDPAWPRSSLGMESSNRRWLGPSPSPGHAWNYPGSC